MLQAMQGILAETPNIQDEVGPDGRQFRMAMVNIMYRDGRPGSEFCLIPVIAWNEQADHLSKYEAGDEIQFIARLNAVRARDHPQKSDLAELSFTIQRIDDSRTLVAAMERFLHEFTPPQPSLTDRIHQAEYARGRNDASGKEPMQAIQP